MFFPTARAERDPTERQWEELRAARRGNSLLRRVSHPHRHPARARFTLARAPSPVLWERGERYHSVEVVDESHPKRLQ